MTSNETAAGPTTRASAPNIYPALGYRDAKAAIHWLCEAFGFEERMVHPGEDGRDVAHAELSFGPGIIMLGSQREDAASAGDTIPQLEDGRVDFARVPFTLYVAVEDPDAHCGRARRAGAEIVADLHDTFYGSREYSARDLEGNIWTFGTYHPAAGD